MSSLMMVRYELRAYRSANTYYIGNNVRENVTAWQSIDIRDTIHRGFPKRNQIFIWESRRMERGEKPLLRRQTCTSYLWFARLPDKPGVTCVTLFYFTPRWFPNFPGTPRKLITRSDGRKLAEITSRLGEEEEGRGRGGGHASFRAAVQRTRRHGQKTFGPYRGPEVKVTEPRIVYESAVYLPWDNVFEVSTFHRPSSVVHRRWKRKGKKEARRRYAGLNKPQWFSVVDRARAMTHPLNRIKSTGYNRDITRDDRVNRSLPAGPDVSIHAPEPREFRVARTRKMTIRGGPELRNQ